MPTHLTEEQRNRFLEGRHVCILGTIGPDGEPVLTPMCYLYRDAKILMRTGEDSIKVLNIARDPRVTVCVQDERPPYKSVTASGRASIEPEQPELAVAFPRHYLGFVGGAAYLRLREDMQQSAEVTIVITPEDFAAEMPFVVRFWIWLKRILPPWL